MRPRVVIFIAGNAVDCKNPWGIIIATGNAFGCRKPREVVIVTGNRKWEGVSGRVLLIF